MEYVDYAGARWWNNPNAQYISYQFSNPGGYTGRVTYTMTYLANGTGDPLTYTGYAYIGESKASAYIGNVGDSITVTSFHVDLVETNYSVEYSQFNDWSNSNITWLEYKANINNNDGPLVAEITVTNNSTNSQAYVVSGKITYSYDGNSSVTQEFSINKEIDANVAGYTNTVTEKIELQPSAGKFSFDSLTITGVQYRSDSDGTQQMTGIDNPQKVSSTLGYSAYEVWAKVSYGQYYSDEDENKDTLYWRVVKVNDDGSAILMADQVIDTMPYSDNFGDTTWSKSKIRQYLNGDGSGDFLAVSGISKTSLVKGTASDTSEDYVWLPSKAELATYGFDGTSYTSMKDIKSDSNAPLQFTATEYAKNKKGMSLKTDSDGNAQYMLRDNGVSKNTTYLYDVMGVSVKGIVKSKGFRVNTRKAGIIPVICVSDIKNNSSVHYVGNVTRSISTAAATKSSLAKVGSTKTVNDTVYTVTKSSASNRTVAVTSVKASATSVTVPSTVTIKGNEYKVTAIKKGAFKKGKKLKKINITSTNLTSVAKTAFGSLGENTTVKLPKSQYKKYKKMIANKKVKLQKSSK